MSEIKKILVSQPRPTSEHSPYFDLANKYGVDIDFRPLIQVEELTPHEYRQQHIVPTDYTAVLINSRTAMDHFFHLCKELRLKVPETMHYYCLSENIANYIQHFVEFRKRRVFFSEHNKWEELLPTMQRRPNERYIMVMSDIQNDDVIQYFASKRITITPTVMYRTVNVNLEEEEKKTYDMLVVFTPTGVKTLIDSFGEEGQGDRILACFGGATIQAAEAAGWRVDISAPSDKYPSIVPAIEDYLKEHK